MNNSRMNAQSSENDYLVVFYFYSTEISSSDSKKNDFFFIYYDPYKRVIMSLISPALR